MTAHTLCDAFVSRVIRRIRESQGQNVAAAISPDDIESFIEMIWALIERCQERRAEVVSSMAQNPTGLLRFRLTRRARRPARRLGVKPAVVRDAILAEAADTTASDLTAAVSELVNGEEDD